MGPTGQSAIQRTTNQTAVLVYRDQLLPYSETFIVAQGEACCRHRCIYVGLATMGRHDWPMLKEALVLGALLWPAPLWKLAFRLWGVMPLVWRKHLKAYDPQLVHAHFGPDGGFASFVAKALKIPLVVTFHGYDATCRSGPSGLPWGQSLRRGQRHLFFKALALQRRCLALESADCVIAVSQFIRRRLVALGCPPQKIVVHYTGVDVTQFRPDRSLPRERVVLFVGRLVEKKGCGVLIRAMARVQAQLAQRGAAQGAPEAKLVIIGEGGLRSQLEAQAAGLSHCQFLGVQSPEQVRHWMNRSWLLCAPSVTARSGDAEGLGMVLLEAQAMELPVVASRCGGMPEAVIEGQTGHLVPEGQVAALAAALLSLLEDKALRDRMGRAGRAYMLSRFDLAKNTARLERLYSRLIETVG